MARTAPANGARDRIYTEADVKRLRGIKHLRQVEGLNFAAIRMQLGPVPEEQAENSSASPGTPGPTAPGEQLRRLRVKAQKTLKEVAEATGLSISLISALERGTYELAPGGGTLYFPSTAPHRWWAGSEPVYVNTPPTF